MGKEAKQKKQIETGVDELPQNYRGITAGLRMAGKCALWGITAIFFLVSYTVFLHPTTSPVEQAKLRVLLQPNDAAAHYELGKAYLASGDTNAAKHELSTAERLSPGQTQVLGESTSLLAEIQTAPQKIKREIAYWQSVALHLQDYRDAYLQLSALSYQLNRLDEAKAYVAKALDIDPNHLLSQKLQVFLNQFSPKQRTEP